MVNWRTVHYFSYIAVLYFVFEPSYIHPDEHFQSLEVLTSKFYGFSTNIPWEFKQTPSRSYAVLYLIYGPILYINKLFQFRPLGLLYLVRLQLASTYFLVVQRATRILCDTKQENTKTKFFIYTSYVTWTYQSHTFSNAIETQLLLIALACIQVIRTARKSGSSNPQHGAMFIIGVIVSIGIFNRITFVAFLILPGLIILKHFINYRSSLPVFLVSLTFTSLLLIYYDTQLFGSQEYVITPWNNFLYNSQTENLAQHGLHPRYTHLLINLPQIIGPLIIPFIFRNHYKNSIAYLAIVSGLLCLSVIPHQELRFLAPLVPLICICIDFTNFENPLNIDRIMKAWVLFNIVLGIIMGSFHQRGVIVTLDHLYESKYHGSQVWWKTYTPPTWLLGNQDLMISKNEPVSGNYTDLVIDLMGADVDELVKTVGALGETILITPRSSLPLLESVNSTVISMEKVWSYQWHLDMDHFDVNDLRTFHPGIDVYKVAPLLQ